MVPQERWLGVLTGDEVTETTQWVSGFLETSHLLFSSSTGGLQSDYHTEQSCVNKLFTGLMIGFSGQEISAFFF